MRESDFERLFAEHAQPLFGFLAYRTGDRAAAEDLLADTFERAFRARRRFDRRRGKEKSWLYAIAVNCLRDHLRRRDVERRAIERAREPALVVPSHADLAIERGDLWRALDQLSSEEREAVALRYGAGLTVPEIARITGVPLTTAEGRVARALRRLRSELVEP